MEIEDTTRVKAKDLAALYAVSSTAISLWHSKSGCPRNKDGTYDLGVVIRWRLQRVQDESKPAKIMSSSKALDRKRNLDAELKQMQLDERRGQLISIADVEQGRVQRIREVKRSLLAVPRAIASRLIGKTDRHEIEQIINGKLKAICDQFARD